jgi:hypothetical protein
MLKEAEIKDGVEAYVCGRSMDFKFLANLVESYMEDKTGKTSVLYPNTIPVLIQTNMMGNILKQITDFYSDKYGMSILRNKQEQIVKIIWKA